MQLKISINTLLLIVLFLTKRDADGNGITKITSLSYPFACIERKRRSFEINFSHQSQDEFLPSVELSPYANIFMGRTYLQNMYQL